MPEARLDVERSWSLLYFGGTKNKRSRSKQNVSAEGIWKGLDGLRVGTPNREEGNCIYIGGVLSSCTHCLLSA